jgi:hypothetical protein
MTATSRGVAIAAHCADEVRDCPACGTPTRRVHGRYERTLVDVPAGCREVVVRLTVRRFRCTNPGCPVATFAEQVPGLTSRWARRTQPVTAMLAQIGLVLAGRAGARLADGLGVAVGRNVLLRIVRALPVPNQASQQDLRVLGVDDFALRRGHVYGTVLVDLDTHRPIDLLPERTAEPVAGWLRHRPGVEVICRDRAGAYAQAAAEAAPSAIQVADRWHLWHNLAQHVERAVTAHRRCWSPPLHSAPSNQSDPDARSTPDGVDPGHGAAGRAEPTILEPPGQAKGGRLAVRDSERWQLVHDLLDDGLSLKEISRRTGLARGTVRRFARVGEPAQLDRGQRPLPGSGLDAHRAFLVQQWRAGNTNAADLLRQLRTRGYRGSDSLLRQYVRPWRAAPPDPHAVASTGPASASTREVTHWICTRPEDLKDDHRAALATVLCRCQHLDRLAGHVRVFAHIVTTLAGEQAAASVNECRLRMAC